MNELIVVTGASTGIGAATAQELARKGFHVLAGVRREVDAEALRGLDVKGPGGIEPRILDITVESDMAAIADRVAQRSTASSPSRAGQQRRDRDQCASGNTADGASGAGSSRSICSVTSR